MVHPMRNVLGNFWILVRGRGAAAVMVFATTAITARILGPSEFGVLVLLHTYAMFFRAALDFDSVDAVVRFSVPLHDAGDKRSLARLIKSCRKVDIDTSRAATVLALFIAPIAGFTMGLKTSYTVLLTVYTLVLLTTCTGTASGILRLYNRLDILGTQMTIAPALRFLGLAISWFFNNSLESFVITWMIAYAAENFYLLWHANREYKEHILPAVIESDIHDAKLDEFNGLRHFMWMSYWQSNMDILPKHITTILVGYILGPAEAGLLRLARELSSMLNKPAVLIRQVIFLDLTRTWHQGSDAFDVIAYRTAMLGAIVGSVFVTVSFMFGDKLLLVLLGKEYVAAKSILTLMLLAASLELVSSPIRSACYAIGHASKVLKLYVLSTSLYLILFVTLTKVFGLMGAGMAACAAAIIPLIGMVFLIRKNRGSIRQ